MPQVGGLLMVGSSYFCETALVMSGAGVALIGGIWWATQRGIGEE